IAHHFTCKGGRVTAFAIRKESLMARSNHSKDEIPFSGLLEQARAGSLEALGKVLEACRTPLYRKAQHIGRPRSLRAKYSDSDLLQDTFMEAQGSFNQF